MAQLNIDLTLTITGKPALLVIENAIRFRLDPDNEDRRLELFAAVDAIGDIDLGEALGIIVGTKPSA